MRLAELTYPTDDDSSAHVDHEVTLGSSLQFAVSVDAITESGRKEFHGPQGANEDAFAFTRLGNKLIAAVFDGASSQQPIPELAGESGARFASHRLKAHLEGVADDFNATQILPWLNLQLRKDLEQFASVSYKDLNTLPTSTATVAQLDPDQNRLTVWHVGDSFALVVLKHGAVKLLTNDLHKPHDDEIFKLIRQIAAERGITPREARQDPRVKPAIMHMFQTTRNRSDGTGEGMLNGDPHMERYIHTSTLPLSEVSGIFIGSDGIVPPVWDIQNNSDTQHLASLVTKVGVGGLLVYSREQADLDPDWKNTRYKHSDDATGIWIRLLNH